MRFRNPEQRYWTDEELRILSSEFYDLSDTKLAEKLNRTESAICEKRKELHLSRLKMTKLGEYSLKELVEETGYSATQFLRVRRLLGQMWGRRPGGRDTRTKKVSKGRVFLISNEQADELLEFLRTQWSPTGLRCCRICQRKDRQHKARGLCATCYRRENGARARGARDLISSGPLHCPHKAKFKPLPESATPVVGEHVVVAELKAASAT